MPGPRRSSRFPYRRPPATNVNAAAHAPLNQRLRAAQPQAIIRGSMSLAGKRSTQGDEYQLCVALHWLTRLMRNDEITGIQVESVAIPGETEATAIDDIVILFRDGHREYAQVKKNQLDYKAWALSDPKLAPELVKMRMQLEKDPSGRVLFYSGSSFGDFQKLAEECNRIPEYPAFEANTSGALKKSLQTLAAIIARSEADTFALAKKVQFGGARTEEEWNTQNLADLDQIVPRAKTAKHVLERLIQRHSASNRDSSVVISREDVFAELRRHEGLYPAPQRSEREILASFAQASRIGRSWPREIGGTKIPRPELEQIVEHIAQGKRTILVTDRPGSGKTCLLLDLVEHLERRADCGVLFIKSDHFSEASSELALTAAGLPEDIVGQCSRLAASRRVVVIIDSLDVLSTDRQHGALRTFLSLIDRLCAIPGLSLVTSCREFDLRYDPNLRGQHWDQTVSLPPLDFERIVAPLLRSWNVDPSQLSPDLAELLRTPQNLRLFERIAPQRTLRQVSTAHDLYQVFLDEMISKDPHLGQSVLLKLQKLAGTLLQKRTPQTPRPTVDFDEPIFQRLRSLELLLEPSVGSVSFGHQTLAEALAVQNALRLGQGLGEFILAHPALPFIRPTVRAFFFHLRSCDQRLFRKQVRAVLSHDGVAYHLKRLVSESLAEIKPTPEDWPLIRRLYKQSPDLFHRFLVGTKGSTWFRFLVERWLPEARATAVGNWRWKFLAHSRVWAKKSPKELVALWLNEMRSEANAKEALQIAFGLDDVIEFPAPEIRPLFESLLVVEEARDFIIKSLSRWVSATNQGDDLLWRAITEGVALHSFGDFRSDAEPRCESHQFFKDTFFEERLCRSDALMSLVMSDIKKWANEGTEQAQSPVLRVGFLYSTSWNARHSSGGLSEVDSTAELFRSLESALKVRAARNDAWWHENEPKWRSTSDMAVRYLFLEAYRENVLTNLAGIEAELTDVALLRCTELEHEVLLLMNEAYPYISPAAQDANQATILALDNDLFPVNEDRPKWLFQHIFDQLLWIPCAYRNPEAQNFVDRCRTQFPAMRSKPFLFMNGGVVTSPVSLSVLLDLSDKHLFRLIHHYDADTAVGVDERLAGGCSEIKNVLHQAASVEPKRFLKLIQPLMDQQVGVGYVRAIVGGVAAHVRSRAGSLTADENWKPIGTPPSTHVLATWLLAFAESQVRGGEPVMGKRELATCGLLDACCQVLHDPRSAERLTMLVFRLLYVNGVRVESTQDAEEDEFMASNSPEGKAADAAMVLCNHLVNLGVALPALLPPLLHHFASAKSRAPRICVLRRLPFLVRKQPDLGWSLFTRAVQEPGTRLWRHAGQVFYYEYQRSFERVEPFLQRLKREELANAGDTYGRIMTLASLVGHLSQDKLFLALEGTNDETWKGAARVFIGNLTNSMHRATCIRGLHYVLSRQKVPGSVLDTIGHAFESDAGMEVFDFSLAHALLSALRRTARPRSLGGLVRWLGHRIHQDPMAGLECLESIAELASQTNGEGIASPRSLVTAVLEILREADETDDRTLVERAVALQDTLLFHNVNGMDVLLDAVSGDR